MKPICKNISLTILTLVAGLALTARANGPRALYRSSAAPAGHAAIQQFAPPFTKAHPLWSDDTTIYDNGGPNQQNGNEMTEWIQAEDFNLSADSTLSSVNFWDIEAPGGTAYQGEIDWILYADAGGQPGASFASGAAIGAAVTRTFIQGGVLGFYDEYSLSFNVSPGVPLTAGTTYWLGLHNGPLTMTTYSSFYWETTNFNGTYNGHEDDAPFDGGWFDNGSEHAFNLGGGGGGGLTLTSAFSEKGPFDIDLPLAGSGVEDRSGGPNKKYAIYFVVSGDLASVGGATSTCGSVAHFGPDPDVPNQAEVDLVNVGCNESELTVTATNLVDTQGNTLDSASVTFGLLIGDVNGDRVVDQFDRKAVKADLGTPADQSNFREDVATVGHNSSGFINSADLKLVERQQGTSLP